MLTPQLLQSLSSLIATAVTQAEQLFALLESEQTALLAEDHAALESLIEQKLLLSHSLDDVERQRQEVLLQAGQEPDLASMTHLLQAHQDQAAYSALSQSWDTLMACLKKAADQNRLNGILLEKQRQHVQRALNILFEQSNSGSVYDAAGTTSQTEFTRSVGIV